MKISRLVKEQKDFFLAMDPLMMMDRLEFPGSFALIATEQNETPQVDIPVGLMICSQQGRALIIDWLCVASEYRTKGIGEQLLTAAFDTAVHEKCAVVCAYINQVYGRDLICAEEETYLKERFFSKEQMLPGEWLTDLRTLSKQPCFNRKFPIPANLFPLRKLSATQVRGGIASLSKAKKASMLYPVNGSTDVFDPDLSFLSMDGDNVCGGLLVQCVNRSFPEIRKNMMIRSTENVLYPALFCAGSGQEAGALLLSSLQAAKEKYSPDTDVHVIVKSNTYANLIARILPNHRIENKLLIADVDDYAQEDPSLRLLLRQMAQLG